MGALGEDHTKECPGAIMPALPQLVSAATNGCRSTITTSWPSFCNWYAVVTPTTPPPSTITFMMSSDVREPAAIHGSEVSLPLVCCAASIHACEQVLVTPRFVPPCKHDNEMAFAHRI